MNEYKKIRKKHKSNFTFCEVCKLHYLKTKKHLYEKKHKNRINYHSEKDILKVEAISIILSKFIIDQNKPQENENLSNMKNYESLLKLNQTWDYCRYCNFPSSYDVVLSDL
jgi:hypothetical protein